MGNVVCEKKVDIWNLSMEMQKRVNEWNKMNEVTKNIFVCNFYYLFYFIYFINGYLVLVIYKVKSKINSVTSKTHKSIICSIGI